MKYGLLLSGIIIIVLVLGMSGCVSNYDSKAQKSSTEKNPLIVAQRSNDTTVTIYYLYANGAKDVEGLHVVSPSIGSPDIIARNTSVPKSKGIKISDPNMAGKVNLVVTSSVDNNSRVVLNVTI